MPQRSAKIIMAPGARLAQEGRIGLVSTFSSPITQHRDLKIDRTRTGQMPQIEKFAPEHPRHAGVIMNGNRVGHTGKLPVATTLIDPRCTLEAASARPNIEVRA